MALTPALGGSLGAADKEAGFAAGVSPGDLGICVLQGLAEYCTLIDSSSSFRAYRAALADVEPPCIPYL